MISVVASQEGCGFASRPGTILCGVFMFTLLLHGFFPGSCHSPKTSISGELVTLNVSVCVRMNGCQLGEASPEPRNWVEIGVGGWVG